MLRIEVAKSGQGEICAPILRALPAWFGIEEATQHYIDYTEQQPTSVAFDGERAVGFLALAEHTAWAAEIYVMGVLPDAHRQGVGRALVAAAEADLRARGFEYLQVKTLAETHPDKGYKKTRAFYRALGFRDVEVFPELWGASNPCLQLIKRLQDSKTL